MAPAQALIRKIKRHHDFKKEGKTHEHAGTEWRLGLREDGVSKGEGLSTSPCLKSKGRHQTQSVTEDFINLNAKKRHSGRVPWQVPALLLLGLIPGIIRGTGRVFLIPIHQFIPVPGKRVEKGWEQCP